MRAILVGTLKNGSLYYDLDGKENDGIVITRDGETTNVDVASLIRRGAVTPIRETEFHEFFWDGPEDGSTRWQNIFIFRVQDVPESLLSGVQVLQKMPDRARGQRKKEMEEKAIRADVFKTLLESGQHEKALGRSLGRFGRRATAGVRGFVRDAIFNPDAIDSDEDGWVQEGTQFARRAVPRRTQGINNSVGLRSASRGRNYQNFLVGSISERLARRDANFYVERMDKVDGMIESRFNGGKRIKTRREMKAAFEKAHPGFVTGDSTAGYLDGDIDETISALEREHGYMFLLAMMANPDLKKANWKLTEVPADAPFSGAASFKGMHKIDEQGRQRPVRGDRKPMIEIFYKSKFAETDHSSARNFDRSVRMQLENSKVVSGILRSDMDPKDAEELADRMYARSTAFHEFTHGANYLMAYRDSIEAMGLDPDSRTDAKTVMDSIRTAALDVLSMEKKQQIAESFFADKYDIPFPVIAHSINELLQRASRNSQASDLFADTLNTELNDGARNAPEPITVSAELADFFNKSKIPKIFPSPSPEDILNGSAGDDWKWEEGDAMTIVGTLNALDALMSDLSTGSGYMNRRPWNGRKAVDIDQGNVMHSKFNWSLLLEHGVPSSGSDGPAIAVEDVRTLLQANFRLGDVMQVVSLTGSGTSVRDFSWAARNAPSRIPEQLRKTAFGGFPEDQMEFFYDAVLDASIQRIWQSAVDTGNDRDRGRLIDTFAMLLGVWDDLTPQQREAAREFADLAGGGLYAAYMGHITNDTIVGRILDARSYELLAELGAMVLFGNYPSFADVEAGEMRDLTPDDPAFGALEKLVGWLWPDMPFKLEGGS